MRFLFCHCSSLLEGLNQNCFSLDNFNLFLLLFGLVYQDRNNTQVIFNSFLTMTGKFSVMIGTLLYVFDSHECHSKLVEEMHIPLRPIPK